MLVAHDNVRYLLFDQKELLESSLGKKISDADKPQMLAQSQALVDEAKSIALEKLGLKLGGNSGEKVQDTQIVEAASAYIDPEESGVAAALQHYWRVNSGHAHGLGWPELLNKPTIVMTSDGIQYRHVVGDEQAIAEGIAGAWLMTTNAFRLYVQRATPA